MVGCIVVYMAQNTATDEYEKRVQELMAEGMTRSDAQGIADAEQRDAI